MWRCGLVWLAALQTGATLGPDATPRIAWERRLDALAEDPPTALARGARGQIALGGGRGVRVLDPDGRVETRLRRGPVVDLAFGSDDALWVATGHELYRVAPDGSAQRESLAQRDDDARVVRLAAAGDRMAAATDRGVQLREADGRWQPLHVLPSGVASLVAFREGAMGLELWSVIEGELWVAGCDGRPDGPWHLVSREPLPLTDREEHDARDLAFALPEADAVLVFSTFLAVRDARGAWRRVRLALPPGARASRITRALGALWLASDAGLLSADALAGPWRRAAPPLGSLPVVDLEGGDVLWVATHRGLGVATRVADAAPLARSPGTRADVDHARVIAGLHRAALRQQGLRPESLRDLHERIRLRGWWPELDVSFGYADFHDHRYDYDQSFVSGDTRHLYDRQRDRGRDLDVAVTLSWDLGDTAFHPEELDALRESRSLIALRDDVLDEVTALYFERQEVMARLAASPDGAERLALELRAAALAAGLDAWTGGAFSALPASSLPAVPSGG